MQSSKIISIKKVGKIPTMDIKVDSVDHLFYANGIATSNSHSVAYAQHAYVSAYAKAHFPKEFFCVYLKHAKHRGFKKDIEKRVLIQDARKHGIDVRPFDIRDGNEEYAIIDGDIKVGFIDLKNCGSADYKKWQAWLDNNEIPDTWDEFLVYATEGFNKQCFNSLIMAGAFDHFKMSRNKMAYQYSLFQRLNDRQLKFVRERYSGSIRATLIALESAGSGSKTPNYNKRSLEKTKSLIKDWTTEAYNTWTNAFQIEKAEMDIIGAPLTCSRLDESDAAYVSDTTCLDIENMRNGSKEVRVLAWVTDVRQIKTKKGDDMAFVAFSDGMYEFEDGVIFPDQFQLYHYNLIPDMEVLIVGYKSNTGSFIVNKVIEV